VTALWAHRERQAGERAAADLMGSERDLVFSTRIGAALDAANVRREFKAACKAAGIGQGWTPRELRHSFVPLMSSSGVPVEEIARLARHSNSRTTEVVYRRELRPVLTTGAEAMDRLFKVHESQWQHWEHAPRPRDNRADVPVRSGPTTGGHVVNRSFCRPMPGAGRPARQTRPGRTGSARASAAMPRTGPTVPLRRQATVVSVTGQTGRLLAAARRHGVPLSGEEGLAELRC
jgi:hypothetical protein